MSKFKAYKTLDLSVIADEVLKHWQEKNIFKKSISERDGQNSYVFYEGPPSANGLPGIHHVMARTIKDIFCRYHTLKGKQVKRKAGWDTHGLPVELGVEKELGITKEDIGKKISIEEYNKACRKAVMKYTGIWNDLTEKMGYWVDMDDPYITYKNKYIETVWWLLKQVYNKDLLYKGYTIQPYSPAAGTGLSSHELNMPGTYRDVKDLTATAQFKITDFNNCKAKEAFSKIDGDVYCIAWTTTPWTLPSNTALAVGEKIDYVLVATNNQYSKQEINVILAKNRLSAYFKKEEDYKVLDQFKGSDLVGIKYEQLLPYTLPFENADKAFCVISADYVTTEDGTGIVHIAPTFGADDMRVAKAADIPPMLVLNENDIPVPLVDLRGKFRPEMADEQYGFAGEYVKEDYLTDEEKKAEYEKQKELLRNIIPDLPNYLSVDERLVIKMQQEGKLFKKEKLEHSYPHCWRTDKPILYYPLDSWFVKVTAFKDKLVENNKKINWKPKSTGTGRFGNWLENANDWNLSRSRFWGIPLPIWRSETGEEKCIGSIEELKNECEKAVKAGVMDKNPLADFTPNDFSEKNYETFDAHRPYVDDIVLVSDSGKPMKREADLIDVWFDSGAMPYAQQHYPFENKEQIDENKFYPADFIAEGVDQTRGWFYTLHTIATMCFDSVAYKNVVSNGLVLDKNGQKMSKRLGNAVDPFETLKKYGPDATRWYMISNAQPWDNLKFDANGIVETQRKFFGTLYNTYNFFALYANVDNFTFSEKEIAINERPELDRWVISLLNTLIKNVDEALADYEPTKAARLIQDFTIDNLSNWYVRLSRRRFWKGDYTQDKISAYQTLYHCLVTIAKLGSSIAPFFMDNLYKDLNVATQLENFESVHLSEFPKYDNNLINNDLEEKMHLAQQVSSMVFSLRKKENIKVRQPLQKMMIPVLNPKFKTQVQAVEQLILSETNVKEIQYLEDTDNVLVKKIKPDFKVLGPRFGKEMKAVNQAISSLDAAAIATFEQKGSYEIVINGEKHQILLGEVEITTDDIPGWLVLTEQGITVALDITLNEKLLEEGIARELVNRIQNYRKDKGLELTDKILLKIERHNEINSAVENNKHYICAETLATTLEVVDKINGNEFLSVEWDEINTKISIDKLN